MNMLSLATALVLVSILSTDRVKCVDGTKFIGLGYNILLGNPDGGDLAHTGVDVGVKTTRHILRLTGDALNDLIVTDGQTNCIQHNTTTIFYGPKSYQEYLLGDIVTFGPGDSDIMPYAFTKSTAVIQFPCQMIFVSFNSYTTGVTCGASTAYPSGAPKTSPVLVVFQDIEHRTTATHDMLRDTISVCNKGRTRYVMPPLYTNLHDITVEFASAVCHLPVDYDKDAYGKFLDTWGTHVIVEVEMGSKVVTRHKQSVAQLAKILLTYDIGVGSVKVENYMGYGSVIHLNVKNLLHDDYFRIHGGNVDGILSIGSGSFPQPLAYKMATIATFMHINYWNSVTLVSSNDTCGQGVSHYLPGWQNNTIKALMEYPALKGMTFLPTDSDIKIPVTWPHGTYGLCKPRSGCPKSPLGWAEGWRRQDSENTNNANKWTPGIHLAGVMEHDKPLFYFCMKTTDENTEYERNWPSGNYCILKRGNCPQGFSIGFIDWDDEDDNNGNGHSGALPDGSYGVDTRIYYCCRNDGFSHKAILLPVDHPFYLMRYTSTCQDVYGMIVKEEVFKMDTENSNNGDSCNGAHPFDPGCGKKYHELHYCYYERQSDVNFPSIIIG